MHSMVFLDGVLDPMMRLEEDLADGVLLEQEGSFLVDLDDLVLCLRGDPSGKESGPFLADLDNLNLRGDTTVCLADLDDLVLRLRDPSLLDDLNLRWDKEGTISFVDDSVVAAAGVLVLADEVLTGFFLLLVELEEELILGCSALLLELNSTSRLTMAVSSVI